MLEKSTKNEWLDWLKSIAFACIFVVVMRTFLFSPIVVDGASMQPTYEDRDRVIVNKMNAQIEDLQRFDVIVFEAPSGEDYIKRVIGLPGEHVAYENDMLYINGEAVEEAYLQEAQQSVQQLTQNFTLQNVAGVSAIPDGYVFVLGDNRRNSLDSRDARVGLVPIEAVIGTAEVRVYPFHKISMPQ